jgi:hypothetical protein
VAPDDGGTKVEMTIERRFPRGVAGRTAYALNCLGGASVWMDAPQRGEGVE